MSRVCQARAFSLRLGSAGAKGSELWKVAGACVGVCASSVTSAQLCGTRCQETGGQGGVRPEADDGVSQSLDSLHARLSRQCASLFQTASKI